LRAIGQANNAFIFPGLGLGALVADAGEITESMFAAAAARLAEQVPAKRLASGGLFPPVRQVSARIAEAVVREARESGVGRPLADETIPSAVAEAVWEPSYPALEALSPAQAELVEAW
jgi:malic enzyme